MADTDISLTLNRDEAIVLFEMLSRYVDRDRLEIEHQSEQRVLWDLQCMLEANLHECINNPRYAERLRAARDAVQDDV